MVLSLLSLFFSLSNLSDEVKSRYGPMGIGFAPNRELYTEHFLKPLRSAFSERDLQVVIDLEDDNHHMMI